VTLFGKRHPRSKRLVLSFLPAEEARLQASLKVARNFKARLGVLRSGEEPANFFRKYARLKSDSEFLLAIEIDAAHVQQLVLELRSTGIASTFVIRQDLGLAPEDEEAQEPPLDAAPLKHFARRCAERRTGRPRVQEHWQARLRRVQRDLEEAQEDLAEAAALGHAPTTAAAWFADNMYLARVHMAELRRDLPKNGRHPVDVSHVHELARDLVKHTGHMLTEVSISEALREYQAIVPLSIAEMWLVPAFVRLALLEELDGLATRISVAQQHREVAYLWADRLAGAAKKGSDRLNAVLSMMESEPYALAPHFLTGLAEQLHGEEDALARIQHWIEDRLQQSLTSIVRAEHAREATQSVTTARAFGSLRTLSRLDFTEIFEETNLVDAELRQDPGEIYSKSDFSTRDQCRREVERIARGSRMEEREVARLVVTLASRAESAKDRHVTGYLLGDGVREVEKLTKARIPLSLRILRLLRQRSTLLYLGGIFSLTVTLTAVALAVAHEAGISQGWTLVLLGVLAVLPISELAVQIVNALVISILPPVTLPKMDFERGIPESQATLVVVPIMLWSRDVALNEVEKLEVRFLANRETNLFYGLFSDFTDAPDSTAPEDTRLLETIRAAIARLNERYPGGRFLLFHRPRSWSESEQKWIGRERKRGKIEELNRFLVGQGSPAILHAGSLEHPIRYVITLDADTQLPPGSARRMVETISHPLNCVELDAQTRVRVRGFSIIQPRVSVALPGATTTRFTRIFADAAGLDPYCRSVSDVYQDLFGDGIFHGKAIYEVRSFSEAVAGRFPPESLLSHDLIEGAYAGVGLATDLELFENIPSDYASFSKRQHRWIRGDWQIAPWIFPRVRDSSGKLAANPLSAINRWRIFDNLRKSLVPTASLLLLVLGWLISAVPGVWSLVVGLAIAIPALAPLLDRWARQLQGSVDGWQGAGGDAARAAVMIAFLPHQAWLSVDAIVRALYRSRFSHRHTLEWQTADAIETNAAEHIGSVQRQVLIIAAVSVLLLVFLATRHDLVPAAAFVCLWIGSPLLFFSLSQPARRAKFQPSEQDELYLRHTARRTWRFFDDLVGPHSNWLPPDNSQLALRVEVANRTSPTNIGLWLTSALAARDLGYLTTDDFCRRARATLDTLNRMERYEGHLLNWYDTTNLQPLLPRYVSSVDSGNLLACLWTLARGCEEALQEPLVSSVCLDGMSDTLAMLAEASGDDTALASALPSAQRTLRGNSQGNRILGLLRLVFHSIEQLQEVKRWQPAAVDERYYWAGTLIRECGAWIDVIDRYLRWMEILSHPPDSFLRTMGADTVRKRRRALANIPSLAELARGEIPVEEILALRGTPEMRPEAAAWLDQLSVQFDSARAHAGEAARALTELAKSARAFAEAINMRFLYDAPRRLFAVGYAVGGPLEFTSHYDLLASESRLASLAAIAKGDVPWEHWFALSRPRSGAGRNQTLLSWGGTMFEYLMPLLFTRTYENSLLDQACRQAVNRQIEFGRKKNLPWGVSESAYSALDANKIYQYRAFGVPSLALHPDVDEAPVVAPYATALALTVEPQGAIENLKLMDAFGLRGPMGFYEAIDFSRDAKRDGTPGVIIYTYMSHHQGMSLLAIDNVLRDSVMQRRFHGEPRIRAMETLLAERIPITRLPLGDLRPPAAPAVEPMAEEPIERTWSEELEVPRVHLYGNGRYSIMVTNSGAGYSRWQDYDLTRWYSDTTLDPWGSFLYIRDIRSGGYWSAAAQPVRVQPGESTAVFTADRAEFRRNHAGIETVLSIIVAPEDDVELRRITITNQSRRNRDLELTSYAELALAPHGADRAHPAFSKLFIETRSAGEGLLVAHRRQRSSEDPSVWCSHTIAGELRGIEFETDRAEFLGRGRTARAPIALEQRLKGSAGAVLDPIFSLRCRVSLAPWARAEFTFVTAVGSSEEAVLRVAAKYRRPEAVARAFEMAWTHAQLEFRFLQISARAAHNFQELASHLLYPNSRLRPAPSQLAQNRLGQQALWSMGISGDLPILTVVAGDSNGVPLVRDLLLAHSYWRLRGFRADLVVLNQEAPGYDQPLRLQLQRLIEAHAREAGTDRPGGVFLRDWYNLSENHQRLILAASHAVLSGRRGSLERQLRARGEAFNPPGPLPAVQGAEDSSPELPFLELPFFNGVGGFTRDGREYAIYLGPGTTTPAPWSNVIANPGFGTLITESGLGFTWCGNSQQNRLTPWQNDPVSDFQSEAIYLRDEESGAYWTPTALPIREREAYRARHGQGYTVFEHNSHGIGQELTVFVPVTAAGGGDPVKICRLKLRNHSKRQRRLTATFFAEWVLGASREEQQLRVQTEYDAETGSLFAVQTWTGPGAGSVAFAAASPRPTSFSADRTLFLGRNRSRSSPAGLERGALDNRATAGMDPAAVLQVPATIEPDSEIEIVFLLGQAANSDEARRMIRRFEEREEVQRAFEETRSWWDALLGRVQVRTPQLSVDLLLNRWLPYQALSCRIWGRSALYQSSGAFGFRDQLQDSLAFLYAAPDLTRKQILRAAGRQFLEGDVQHWWHQESGLGVRTRCSDDLLWLPYCAARYAEVTGDTSVFDEEAPFLEGPLLDPAEQERVFVPTVSVQTATVWEHCVRALERAWNPGSHGLPLFGNGDWNDGLNRVGVEGRGESVWVGWFLCAVLDAFADLASIREPEAALRWREQAATLREAIDQHCWDGEWYLRGFFDNGALLGSRENTEGRIDSLAQSWAVIAGGGDPLRARCALESAERFLVDERNKLVLLFTPPFDHSEPHPGYVMGYPPGIRENGGQYTHGSLWLAMAWARLGDGERAVNLLNLMNPIEHCRDPESVSRFRGEPYVAPADVYSAQGQMGRCGWTWYTGSAAWMYRVWLEEVLGFQLRGQTLRIQPVLPLAWTGFEMTYRFGSSEYRIEVMHTGASSTIEADGRDSGDSIRLVDDGATHHVLVLAPAGPSHVAGLLQPPVREPETAPTR
jgi:cyclic beta-1,2-glucan synthetase